MFENTLLILKSDFMGRKCLLLHLLSKGFLIQGNRKLAFTPEDAAEFYKDLSNDKCYMLYVILLSKGVSEAFILRKENAVEQLHDTMICYFGTSVEMDRNVHVSRNGSVARREIQFIFPNYIHEPIEYFDKHKFSKQSVVEPLLCEAFNIIKLPSTNNHEKWRLDLSEWLLKENPTIPQISNQCSHSGNPTLQDKTQQTNLTMMRDDDYATAGQISLSSSTVPGASSQLMSSSTCISCSSFRSGSQDQDKAMLDEFEKRLQMRAIKTVKQPTALKDTICEEQQTTTFYDVVEEVSASTMLEEDRYMSQYQELSQELMYEEQIPQAQEVVIEEAPLQMALVEEHPPAEGENITAESRSEVIVESEEKTEKIEEPKEEIPQQALESAAEPAEEPVTGFVSIGSVAAEAEDAPEIEEPKTDDVNAVEAEAQPPAE